LADMRGGVAGSVEARSVCCLELGCRFCHISVDPSLTLKYSQCKTSAAYNKVLSSMEQVLRVCQPVSIRELSIQFGVAHMHQPATQLLVKYKNAVLDSLTNEQHRTIHRNLIESRNVYRIVAFQCACRLMKVQAIDRNRLKEIGRVIEKELRSVTESFYQYLPQLRPKSKLTKNTETDDGKEDRQKRKRIQDDEDTDVQDVDALELVMDESTDVHSTPVSPPTSSSSSSPRRLKKSRTSPAALSSSFSSSTSLVSRIASDHPSSSSSSLDAFRPALTCTSSSPSESSLSLALRQSKLNFAPVDARAATSSDTSTRTSTSRRRQSQPQLRRSTRSQLRPDSGDEGEVELFVRG